jgi:hypothetical protein
MRLIAGFSPRTPDENTRLMAFENKLSMAIFGHKREERAGGYGKLHNEKQSVSCYPPNVTRVMKSRRMRWNVHVSMHGRGERCMKVIERKTRSKAIAIGTPRLRWEHNVRMDIVKHV